MEADKAARMFAALGHEGRLLAFRLLVDAGPEGLAAGEVARRTEQLQNTSSSHLNVLTNAGLVTSRREGRSIIYSIAYAEFGAVLQFLVQNCCGGRPDLCAPFFSSLLNACSAGGPYDDREINADRNPSGDCCG